MEEKICGICKRLLSLDKFGLHRGHKDGMNTVCKDCSKERAKSYYLQNPDKCKKKSKMWYYSNPEKVKEQSKNSYTKRKNILKEYNRIRMRAKRNTDPIFKLLCNLRTRVNAGINQNIKSARTESLIGCTIEKYKEHIEKQFEPWMTWENWGINTWHIDHIVPLCTFDMSDPQQQKKAFHYTNCRPLSAQKNWSRPNKGETK